MSSHHIVKEDQEPALLIIDPQAISFEKVQELLEWSPTVMVAENALDQVLGWGIKIDIVLCISTHVNEVKSRVADQTPIRFLEYNMEEESLARGLTFLTVAKYKAVNVLIADEKSFHFIQTLQGLDVEVFYKDCKWSFISSGKFEKWVPEGFQFFMLANQAVQSKGLTDVLKSTLAGRIKLESDVPFWVGEDLN